MIASASKLNNRGSVYLVTLITVAAIASMVLVGVTLRSATSSKSALVEEMAISNTNLLNAAELTLQSIKSDPNWKTTAQSGVALSKQTINGVTYGTTVKDADTETTPTATTTNYTLKLTATQNDIEQSSKLTFQYTAADYNALVTGYQAEFYWPLNESPKSTKALDVLAACNGEYLDPNIAGMSTNFHGAQVPLFSGSNDHINIPWTNKFKRRSGTITLWVKSTGTTNFQYYGILGMQYTAGGSPNLSLAVVNNMLAAYISDSGTFNIAEVAVGSSKLTPGAWHHVAITWGSKGLYIYVDGIQDGVNYSNTSGLDTGKARDGGEQPLHIGGGYTIQWSKQPFVGFEGSIAHVVYYNNVQLSASEIAEIAAVEPDEASFALTDDSWTAVYPD